jgi:hypothetical protein
MKAGPRVGTWLVVGALFGWGALAACGGTVHDAGPDLPQAVSDGGAEADASNVQPASDATTGATDSCSGACTDAAPEVGSDASDAGAASDGVTAADGDAVGDEAVTGSTSDASIATERCHVSWPQPSGLTVSSNGVQLVSDSAGGAYLVVTYGEPSTLDPMSGPLPTLDLGVSTAGYQTGVAIVRVDSQCSVSWVREIGAATFSNNTDISNIAAGVDSSSRLTIAGSFWGSVDLGVGVVSTPADASTWSYETYVLQIDPTGSIVFRTVFRSDGPLGNLPTALAVSPSGASAVLVTGGSNADFGDMPDAAIAPNGVTSVRYLVELDASGRVVTRTAVGTGSLSAPPPVILSQVAFDSTGTLWAVGDDVDAGGQSVKLLGDSASLDWQQPIAQGDLFAAGTGGAALLDTSGTTAEIEALQPPGADGGAPSTQSATVSLGSLSQGQQLIIDDDRDVVLAGVIPTGDVEVDAGVYVSGGPSQLAYRAFDPTGALVSYGAWVTTLEPRFGAAAVAVGGDVLLAGQTIPPSGETATLFVARLMR